jgi:hypothetical protein
MGENVESAPTCGWRELIQHRDRRDYTMADGSVVSRPRPPYSKQEPFLPVFEEDPIPYGVARW